MENPPSQPSHREYYPTKGDVLTFVGKNRRDVLKVLQVDLATQEVVLTTPEQEWGKAPIVVTDSVRNLQRIERSGGLLVEKDPKLQRLYQDFLGDIRADHGNGS